jgi:hypothetical protein
MKEAKTNQAGHSEYRIVYEDATGELELVETFSSANDLAAYAYASENFDGDWCLFKVVGRGIDA